MTPSSTALLHQAEEALEKSRRRMRLYETVLSSTPDLVYIFDLDHRFIYANQALLTMWGRTWDEAIGRNCLELGYEPWHAAMHDREINQVVSTRQPVRGEVPFTGTNGRRIYDYIFVPVLGADGGVEAVAGTTRDVTDRHHMEAALRASEEFNRTILENSPDCATILDIQGKLERMNAPGQLMMEIDDIRPLEGQPWANFWPEEKRPAIEAAVASARLGETVRFQGHCPTAKGVSKWWDVIVTPVRNPAGEVFRLLSVARDMTASKATEEQLAAAKATAEAASRAKDDFLAALSHELRTPLNPALLVAVEAERNLSLPENVRADFSAIRRNVELEARLIDDLLDLTRITRGKLRLACQPLDAHQVLQACVGFVQPEIEAHGMRLDIALNATEHWIDADPVRLQQVFWNVLRNAVKFTPPGGIVTLRTSNRAGLLRVDIQDTGIGIDPADLPKIFDAFQQGATEIAFGGLGLGLAITRSLVEQHGGTIAAESEGRGMGATFCLEFPVVYDAGAPASAVDGGSPRAATQPVRRRILLVEDHVDTRETLARLLVRRGHSVSPAGTLQAARALAASGEYDVIISDIGLPDGEGTELLSAFAHTPRKPMSIALTGFGMEEDIQRTLAAGFMAHLTKPINIADLDRLLTLR